jgi:hypothetical protein
MVTTPKDGPERNLADKNLQDKNLQGKAVHEKARAYLFEAGRPLDRARYAYHFEGGSATAVLDALHGEFQNDDGGFGHALEPDIRTAASSVIATTHAFEIFREIHTPGNTPPVQAALDFLLQTFDSEAQVWPMVPPAVEDAPHAPWWTYAETATTFEGFGINPTAAVVAHLLHYVDDIPQHAWAETVLPALVEAVVARIEHKGAGLDLNQMHTVLALRESLGQNQRLRARVESALAQAIPAQVATEPDAWTQYILQPLDVAPTPDAFTRQFLAPELIQRNLDYWLATQQRDGSWPIPWDWSFVDADAWAQAVRDWKGVQIVQRLRTLHAYGQID